MDSWNIKRPAPTAMLDHDVEMFGSFLADRRVALLVTGGVAAMKAPLIARALRRYGAEVVAFVTEEALRYTTVGSLEWASTNSVIRHLSPQSEHLSKERPFDIFLLAPATYNTINKVRNGTADNAVTTTLATALGAMERQEARVIMVPAMHGDFHNSILQESLERLRDLGVDFCPPRDAYGKHNLPSPDRIAAYVCHIASKSPLRDKKILVTAGPTPVPIDNVRGISNRFKGRLGVEIAKHFYLRGADVRLILGGGAVPVPEYLNTQIAASYDKYKDMTMETLRQWPAEFGIFSAAVADYRPKQVFQGKVKSGGALTEIELVPTEKIIDLVRDLHPLLKMISFKYEENIELPALLKKGESRVKDGHFAVVVNRGEEVGPRGEQVAYLVTESEKNDRWVGKTQIAARLADFIESSAKFIK